MAACFVDSAAMLLQEENIISVLPPQRGYEAIVSPGPGHQRKGQLAALTCVTNGTLLASAGRPALCRNAFASCLMESTEMQEASLWVP